MMNNAYSKSKTGTTTGAIEPEVQPGPCSYVIPSLAASELVYLDPDYDATSYFLGAGWNVPLS